MDERLRQLITLGREHYQSNEYEKAESYLAQVAQEHRGFADIFNMLGVIYHSQGRYGEAEESFEEALKINPKYTEAALNLSVTYNDLGKYQLARDVYAQAMAQSADQPRHLDPFARGKIANMHADLGAVYAEIGFYREAVREYHHALDMAPSFVDIRTRLANVYRDMGEYESALAELEKVKQLKPEFIPARLHLGVTLYSLGRKDAAVAEWERVVEIEPGNRSANLYLRMVRDEAHPPSPGAALHQRVPTEEALFDEIDRDLERDE